MFHFANTRRASIEHFVLSALFLLFPVYLLYGIQADSAETTNAPCHTIIDANTSATKFGSPFNLFSSPPKLMMSVNCADGVAKAQIGTGDAKQYVYKYGYHQQNGSWRQITFSGLKTTGDWFVGQASAVLTTLNQKSEGSVLAYVCQQVNGSWKCGCSDKVCATVKWQEQKYATKQSSIFDEDYLVIHGTLSTNTGSAFIKRGETVKMIGEELSKPTYVHFGTGENQFTTVVSDNTNLSFTVPRTIAPGVHKVWFTDEKRRSRNMDFYIVTENPKPVTITSVSPSPLVNGTHVTVRGTGFTKEGNLVAVEAFMFRDLSSVDGKTISFNLIPPPVTREDIPQEVRAYLTDDMIDQYLSMTTIPSDGKEHRMYIQVVNANGPSNAFFTTFK